MYRKLTKLLLVFGLFLLPGSFYAQSPGGIGHQSVWLQGNFFANAAQPYALNFNPATKLGGNHMQIKGPGNISDLRRATIFTVYKKSALDQDSSVWQMTGGFGDLLLSARQVSGDSGKMKLIFEKLKASPSDPKMDVPVLSTYVRRISAKPASENATTKEVAIQLGNPASANPADQPSGLIAEFIVYETILKADQIARIETYLALKYGITLEKNYRNSLGETIWDQKTATLYSNNIAGIGRDDRATLYQKQSMSCTTSDQLVIGAVKIEASNGKNVSSLNDRDYLIWGDNARAFTLDGNAKPGQSNILLSEKKWLMKRSGSTANTIPTELQIDTKKLLPAFYPKENFYLAIDRSGSGDFAEQNCTYMLPDSISADGMASFSKIFWDTDGSGKDVFSFGVKPTLSTAMNDKESAKLLSFHIYPNPLKDGHYSISATLDKRADMIIQIYDLHLHLIDSRKVTGQADYLLSGTINAAAGAYIIKLVTPAKEFSQIVIKQ